MLILSKIIRDDEGQGKERLKNMEKQLIDDILRELSYLGVSAARSAETDVYVNAEFLDASWGAGKKHIEYEASIFARQEDRTVYMHELTREKGRGLSFGSAGESSFQSGKTLFRKVKSVQYGPDGKAYEVELDLGKIPAAVKSVAQKYGWKFKTVVNKKKAMYPAGYVAAGAELIFAEGAGSAAFCTNCGEKLDSGAKFCGKCGSAVGVAAGGNASSAAAAFPRQPEGEGGQAPGRKRKKADFDGRVLSRFCS
jgi:hypothetical protein